MPGLKYLVPALAVVSGVLAQCSTKGTLTITNTADATKLASCQTYTGSVAIHTKAVGDIALEGPKRITGDLLAEKVKGLNSLSASSLQTIDGDFILLNLGSFSGLSMPMLSEVSSLSWTALGPGFTTLDFSSGLTSAKSITIDDTYLTSLEGINPTKPSSVSITNNIGISQLTLDFTDIATGLTVNTNTNGQLSLSMPKLKTAGAISINDCSSLALNALTKTSGVLSVVGNEMKKLSFPKLTEVGGFAINGNTQLKSLSAPQLTTDGGAFSIANNTVLGGTLSFPKLQSIKGAPMIVGSPFTGLSMPKLSQVRGKMTIHSTKVIASICSQFGKLSSATLQGGISCGPLHKSSGGNGGNGGGNGGGYSGGGGSSGSGGSGGSGGGNNAAGHHQASLGVVFTVFGIVAASFALLA